MRSVRIAVIATVTLMVALTVAESATAQFFRRCGRRPWLQRRVCCDPLPACACQSGIQAPAGFKSPGPCEGRTCLLQVIAEYYDEFGVCTYATYDAIRCYTTLLTYDDECGIAVPQGDCVHCDFCYGPNVSTPVPTPGSDPLQPRSALRYCRSKLLEVGPAKLAKTIQLRNGAQLIDSRVINVEIDTGVPRRIRIHWIKGPRGNFFGVAMDAGDAQLGDPPAAVDVLKVGKKGISLLVTIQQGEKLEKRQYVGLVR